MKNRTAMPTAFIAAALVFAMSFVFGAQATSGQGTATPSTVLSTEGGPLAHPAHIHNGTCQDLGDVVYPLSDVAPLGPDATPMASPVASPASGDQTGVAESTTIVDASLDDILNGDYAVNVHESAENIQNYIACGDITGPATNGHVKVDLHELNDSGFTGRAELTSDPDGTTTVTITLMQGVSDMNATPEASPAS